MNYADWVSLAVELREQQRWFQRRDIQTDVFAGLASVAEKMAQRELEKSKD